jgi:hypothetical protein
MCIAALGDIGSATRCRAIDCAPKADGSGVYCYQANTCRNPALGIDHIDSACPAGGNMNGGDTTTAYCEYGGGVPGCTNPIANNYDPAANDDDGSCVIFTPKPNGDRRLCGRGDVNVDFKVDFTDVLAVLAVFGLPAGGGLEDRDVNQDGVLDSADVLMVLGSFGMTCDGLKPPTICPVLPTPGDATIVYSNLQRHAPMTAQVVCDDPAVQATVDARGPVACTGEWPAAAGQWNNNEPTCEVVGESLPEIQDATVTYSNGLSYPTTGTYICGDDSGIMSRTLQPDGTWSAAGELECGPTWLLGALAESCDTACAAVGLPCTDGEWGVVDQASYEAALAEAGQSSSVCSVYYASSYWGGYPAVSSGGACNWSGATSCSDSDGTTRRLCRCE